MTLEFTREYFQLLQKIMPFVFLIFLGFLGNRFLHLKAEFISKTLLYLVAPCVFFFAIADARLASGTVFIPILFFCICTFVCLVTFILNKRRLKSPLVNILAMAVGSGNTGYFGIPVTVALFGESALAFAVMIIFGFMIFENTVGFYITAQGGFSTAQSIKKLLKLPTIYAFIAGVLWNLFHMPSLTPLSGLSSNLRGAYSTLGMMIIGVAAGSAKNISVEKRFLAPAFFAKFLLWPFLAILFIQIDTFYLKLFGQQEHFVILLMSIVPLPANSVVFATELKVFPEKMAKTVLYSTGFALFFIPLVATTVRYFGLINI